MKGAPFFCMLAVGMRDLLFSSAVVRGEENNNKKEKRFFSRDRHGESEKKGKRNQEKCENKAISWIKWDVTGGKTLLCMLQHWNASFLCHFRQRREKKRRKKRVKKQSRGKKKITFSRSGHGVEMDDVHIIRWDWKSEWVREKMCANMYSSRGRASFALEWTSDNRHLRNWWITVSWDAYTTENVEKWH